MRGLFWNTHNNLNINFVLSELIDENNINLVALVEYQANIDELLTMLSLKNIMMQKYCTIGCNRIIIIGDMPNVTPGLQDERYSIQFINNKYILCCVHLPSQIYSAGEGARNIKIQKIINDIEKAEISNDTDNTIIVGDFNINPFDYECIAANLFHSLPYYEIVRKKARTVENESFKMFYNPMWKFFGDDNKPGGTHFYSGSRIDNIFWHIFDQVMIRPSLREFFIDESLKIITETNNRQLIDKNGHPDKTNISDHLPIVYEIKED
ncbi:hypothetical protein [Ruminococcus flavefaciens]|uniref:hypothetical protein n=1 Tax=Ruminococcus flavefaciens TaxID=1265 RepID=UPI0004920874|nr:hypothetical protein [Ruminococcus flavefaciens]